MELIPFSPVGLEAGQDTPEPTEEIRIKSLREKALSKFHLMKCNTFLHLIYLIHYQKPVLSGMLTCQIER